MDDIKPKPQPSYQQQPDPLTPTPASDPVEEVTSSWLKPIFSFLGFLLEVLQILIIVGVLSFIIRMFIVQPFYIIGSSMEPFLHEKELLLIDEISYRFSEPKRGDIVVIEPPRDTRDYIKRIIALPGETIKINDLGQVLVDDTIIYEAYLDAENQFTKGQLEMTLEEDQYFVMGDNRRVSNDSRGSINSRTDEATNPWSVSKDHIVGKAIIRWWPVDKVSMIKRPVYNIPND